MIECYAIYNLKALELFFEIEYNMANKMFHFHKLLLCKDKRKKLSKRPNRYISRLQMNRTFRSLQTTWIIEYFNKFCEALFKRFEGFEIRRILNKN